MEIVIHLFQHTMNLRFLNTRRLAHLQYHSTEQLRRITTPVPNMNSTVETYPHLVTPSSTEYRQTTFTTYRLQT